MNGIPASLPAQPQLIRSPRLGFDPGTVKISLLVFAGYYLGAKLGFAHGAGLPEGDPDKNFSHFFSIKPNGWGWV